MLIVLHANWSAGRLWIWGETVDDAPVPGGGGANPSNTNGAPGAPGAPAAAPGAHPWAANEATLREALRLAGVSDSLEPGEVGLYLPTVSEAPVPSPKAAHAAGKTVDAETLAERAAGLAKWRVPAIGVQPIDAEDALGALEQLDEAQRTSGGEDATVRVALGPGVRWFAAAARFGRCVLAEQRYVPTLVQESDGGLRGSWQPWLVDEPIASETAELVKAMPASARAVEDDLAHEPWAILEDFLWAIVDARTREAFEDETLEDAIEDREPREDPHVAWLKGLLLVEDKQSPGDPERKTELLRSVRRWLGGLDDRGEASEWRLLLELSEPSGAERIADLRAPGDDVRWELNFALQNASDDRLVIDGEEIWSSSGGEIAIVRGKRAESPQELLLAELARAARIYRKLEKALNDPEPRGVTLKTVEAYEFLREVRPLLVEQGFGVVSPEWWEAPSGRLGARLVIESDPLDMQDMSGRSETSAAGSRVGLRALVNYSWQIAVGDATLTLKEFESLAHERSPLVRVNGQWVEVRPEDVDAAMRFIRENPGGTMTAGEALRIAYGADEEARKGAPILGMRATGWMNAIFGDDAEEQTLPIVEQPEGFIGDLRPYQKRGLSWLAFLDRFGLGGCLADDMGLGKTIQLLALLALEREEWKRAGRDPREIKPTLLIAPTSVVRNWMREANRFAPTLRVRAHHGVERSVGQTFANEAKDFDLIITTYALAHRDKETLELVEWGRVALDEAQNIKNPVAKQSQSVRGLKAERRIALTGTPVENRLTELWSVMDFCNPGYLGSQHEFRRNFAIPIERRHSKNRRRQLRGLVQPFILRRLKTDPNVVSDLPAKLESKELCQLTSEQAAMYEQAVNRMLGEVDKAEGMQRRGIVLSTLIKLKQICNHPAQAIKEGEEDENADDSLPVGLVQPSRSGKCVRLLELLDEVLAEGDQALVFTQFRRMGKMLTAMLRHELDREVLFLHGGTPQHTRQEMVDRFQKADGTAPIFVLSLKAGGVGLNLTAASHVFHFDRWWNPAVENQATDRAHRIGQTRTVQVHKFIVSGTLEEKIDEMIEAKTELAEQIIGSGEQWLTEMSTDQLREILTLRPDAVLEDDAY
ncbi:MAG: DEAD/DEAH box helicase [Phycisphaerales bacterium]